MHYPGYPTVVPRMVSTLGPWSPISATMLMSSAPVSGTFPDIQRAHYYPIVVPTTCVIRRLWWANGAVAAYNIDCGVYLDAGYKPGAKLISSGTTAQGNTNEIQFVDVTDTTLAPGLCWLAIDAENTDGTTTVFRGSASAAWNAATTFEQASVYPLPATATPVESAYTQVFLFGFATTASP